MKKIIITIVISVILIMMFCFNSSAINFTELWNELDEQTIDYLDEIGVNEISLEELFEVTPERIIKFLFDLAFEKGVTIIPNVIKMLAVIILYSIGISFLKETRNLTYIINIITTVVLLSLIIVPIIRMLTDIITCVKTTAVFINAYLPIMTSIIIASKNPSLAITYNSLSLFLSSTIVNIADKILIPAIGGLLSFNIISSISFENYKTKIFNTIRKIIIIFILIKSIA